MQRLPPPLRVRSLLVAAWQAGTLSTAVVAERGLVDGLSQAEASLSALHLERVGESLADSVRSLSAGLEPGTFSLEAAVACVGAAAGAAAGAAGAAVAAAAAVGGPEVSSASPDPPSPQDLEAFGITPALGEFVGGLTVRTFRDFPAPEPGTPSGQSLWEEEHAQLALRAMPHLSDLRYVLVPRRMADSRFWRVYFTITASRLAACRPSAAAAAAALAAHSAAEAQRLAEEEGSLSLLGGGAGPSDGALAASDGAVGTGGGPATTPSGPGGTGGASLGEATRPAAAGEASAPRDIDSPAVVTDAQQPEPRTAAADLEQYLVEMLGADDGGGSSSSLESSGDPLDELEGLLGDAAEGPGGKPSGPGLQDKSSHLTSAPDGASLTDSDRDDVRRNREFEASA